MEDESGWTPLGCSAALLRGGGGFSLVAGGWDVAGLARMEVGWECIFVRNR